MKREYSLKRNEDIAVLVKLKQSVGNRYYAIYYQPNQREHVQIAISVSKKYGDAVHRNYEKRVTREIVRLFIHQMPKFDVLIVLKQAIHDLSFIEKKEQLTKLINRIIKLGEKNVK